jgi:hypothetical protein
MGNRRRPEALRAEVLAIIRGRYWDFGRTQAAANPKDLHRSLRADDDLEDAFAWKEERAPSRALTLQ